METSTYNVENELTRWKEKIDRISRKFATLPSGKKAKLMGYIRELDILAAELDERIEVIEHYGWQQDDGYWLHDVKVDIDQFRSPFTETAGTYMDYDYSG